MSKPDYVPAKEELFNDWQFTFKTVLTGYGAEDFMPPAKYHELMRLGDDYDKKFAIAENSLTRNSVTINDRQKSRAVYEKYIRDIVQTYLVRNPNLTDGQRIAIGIPVHKTTHTPAPVNNTAPGFKIKLPSPGVVEVSFFNAENNKMAKPEGQHGAGFAWAVLDNPPSSYEELIHSAFDTRSPYVFEFDITHSGRRLYFAMRWENTRGVKGHWGKIESTIIP
ncbi:MAG: hypothetical protein LBJ17_02835 [Dysgonamonadaceae bacterium]|jgi:hypothetical protein|nr:hypothetical protein [Dysgonamonadaceae bacterium]